MRFVFGWASVALLSSGLLAAAEPDVMHLKVLALAPNGAVVPDLSPKDWTVAIGGKTAEVAAQRGPQEVSSSSQKWALVFLPIRTPEARKLALTATAAFLKTLPATDSVLLVLRTDKGLECLTPGFTASPELWAKGLDRLAQDMTAGFRGDAESPFVLPETPAGDKAGDIRPIEAFQARLNAMELNRLREDGGSKRSLFDDYAPEQLGAYSRTVSKVLKSLEQMGSVLAKAAGEKQVLIFSRNEMDDLASPQWANPGKYRTDPTAPKTNPKLQVDLMRQEVTLARLSLQATFTGKCLTLHSVAGTGLAYGGALGEAATQTGGHGFRFDSNLEASLPQVLSSWAMRYDLSVSVPAGLKQPAKIELKTHRKDVRLISALEY